MKGKISLKFILFIALLILLAGAFYYFNQNKKTVVLNIENGDTKSIQQDNIPDKQEKLYVAGWIPYWDKDAGTSSVEGNAELFNELNPFAFGVDASGNITDVLKIKAEPWKKLSAEARNSNTKIIPTILWGDAKAMHAIFSDQGRMEKHVGGIVSMLDENNFSGVDIDYEGKDIADQDNFSAFLKTLHEKLLLQNKTLSCTVEARTGDNPPAGFLGVRAMSWANDFSALNKNCDSVRLMAYDQVFQIHRTSVFEEKQDSPSAPNASDDWVEQNVQYALKYIAPEKLLLGVPTYGWEFSYSKTADGFKYSKIGSINYPYAVAEAEKENAKISRTPGGELSFVYKIGNENRLVTFEDAQSVEQKIAIAKKYSIKGVSLFKIDGAYDPKILDVIGR